MEYFLNKSITYVKGVSERSYIELFWHLGHVANIICLFAIKFMVGVAAINSEINLRYK